MSNIQYREDGSCGSSRSAEDDAISREAANQLRELMDSLPPKQQLVVQLRFGFWDGVPWSQDSIAERMRVDRSTVSRLETRALKSLRKRCTQMDQELLVDDPYAPEPHLPERQTHKPHIADWRQDWVNGTPTLRYVGTSEGWYVAPPCEGEPDEEGEVVYVVHAREVGKVKIGRTNDLRRRLSGLQTGSPVHLEVIRVYTSVDGVSEGSLHDKFARYRLHGEWFDDSVLDELP